MALKENFTTYDVTDGTGSTYTVTSSRVSWNDMARTETSHVSDSKGANYFDGDFIHEFEMEFSDLVGSGNVVSHWGLANVQKNMASIMNDKDDAEWFYHYSTYFYVDCVDGGDITESESLTLEAGTHYYVRIIRDDDGGSNNAGQVTAYVFKVSFDGTLVGSISAEHTIQHDFEYIYASLSYNDSTGGHSVDGFTENLDLYARQDYTREDSSALASDDTNLSTNFSTSDYIDVAT